MGWWGNIDWSATGAWMQAWAGFAGAGAVVYAASKGAATYRRWLTEKQTERHLAVAERILGLAYRIKRAMKGIRSPGAFGGDVAAAEQSLRGLYEGFDQFPNDRQRRLATAQVAATRIDGAKDEWEELFACMPLAKAYFGDEIEAQLGRLWACEVDVAVALQMYGRPEIDEDFREKMERVIWDGINEAAGEPDPINVAVGEAIAALEARLLPILRAEVSTPSNPGSRKTGK